MIITGRIAGHEMVDGRCKECGKLWRDICDVRVDNVGPLGSEARKGWAHIDPGTDGEAKSIEEWRAKELAHFETVFARS
jgi:hypothetical protein